MKKGFSTTMDSNDLDLFKNRIKASSIEEILNEFSFTINSHTN